MCLCLFGCVIECFFICSPTHLPLCLFVLLVLFCFFFLNLNLTSFAVCGYCFAAVVPPNLREEESLLQALDALGQLDNVVNNVFSRIGEAIEANKKDLVDVNNRINLARAKVEKIVGTSMATTVYSSARYPGPEKLKSLPPLFDGEEAPLPEMEHHIASRHVRNLILASCAWQKGNSGKRAVLLLIVVAWGCGVGWC